MNSFEEYLKKNRTELDTVTPNQTIWQSIEYYINKKKSISRISFFQIAAAILLIFGFSFLIYKITNKVDQNNDFISFRIPSEYFELKKLEGSYIKQINVLTRQIEKEEITIDNPEYFQVFISHFKEVDNKFKMVQNNIDANGMDDNMIENIIRYYQNRISDLEQLQSEIKRVNQQEQNKDAKYKIKL